MRRPELLPRMTPADRGSPTPVNAHPHEDPDEGLKPSAPFLLLLPAIVMLVAVVAAAAALLALFELHRLPPDPARDALVFVGWRNYSTIFSDPISGRRSGAPCCF